MGQAMIEGSEIISEEFAEAVATAVLNSAPLSPTLLRTLHIPPITTVTFITKDGHSFRPIAATREKFSAHLAYVGKQMGL
jgi:hypothetical protein